MGRNTPTFELQTINPGNLKGTQNHPSAHKTNITQNHMKPWADIICNLQSKRIGIGNNTQQHTSKNLNMHCRTKNLNHHRLGIDKTKALRR